MTDFENSDPLAAKRDRNRQQRIDEIKRWVDYIREQPPDVWGEQLNTLVESQLESAQNSKLDPEQYQRVRDAGRDYSE